MKNYRPYFRFLILAVYVLIFVDMRYLSAQYETDEKGQGGSRAPAQNYDKPGKDLKEQPVEVKNKLCPVRLTKITTGDKFTYVYKGKIYRFSSAGSIEEFKKDPQEYLKEWEKKERFRRINVIDD